ncbi:MAG: hypothetical protein IT424_13840 [Pirellulales bacterium]|nr:hypothetical protein [Pirellulales bacterium]
MGCFSALIGGVALGSLYLGVDVRATLRTVLEQTLAIPNQPLAVAPGAPLPASGATATPPLSSQSGVAVEAPSAAASNCAEATRSVAAGDAAAPQGETPLRAGTHEPVVEPATSSAAAAVALTIQQRQEFTQAYWTALNDCLRQEVVNRSEPRSQSPDGELREYLARRADGHNQAARQIARISRRGVDAHVVALGDKARAWQEEGARLYAEAQDLLTDAPSAQLSGPFAKTWHGAAMQHEMEERLLAEKCAAVESYLQHRYELSPGEIADAAPAPSGR